MTATKSYSFPKEGTGFAGFCAIVKDAFECDGCGKLHEFEVALVGPTMADLERSWALITNLPLDRTYVQRVVITESADNLVRPDD